MSDPADDGPIGWMPSEARNFHPYAGYLKHPDDFIQSNSEGEPVLVVVPEDDVGVWTSLLADRKIIAFDRIRFYGEDVLEVRADGSWSSHTQPPAGTSVRFGQPGTEVDRSTLAEAATDLFRTGGPGHYSVAYLKAQVVRLMFRNGRFEEECLQTSTSPEAR